MGFRIRWNIIFDMSKTRLERKVGLFVCVGLVLLAGLLLEFTKGLTFFRPHFTIHLRAANAGNMKVRAQVLMAGVPVGNVGEIRLDPSGASVLMSLVLFDRYQNRIFTNSQFTIEQLGFLGDQYVAITPLTNSGPVFLDNDFADATTPFNLQEVARSANNLLVRFDTMAQRLNGAIADLQRLLLNEQTLTNLSATATNLRRISESAVSAVNNLDVVIATNGPAIALSTSNLVAFSEQLDQAGISLNELLATNSPGLQAAVKNIESSTEVMKTLMEDTQAGKGAVGTLLRNQQLADQMSQIVANLSITTSNLNRVGLWGILWQHRPPRAGGERPRKQLVAPKERTGG